MKKTCDDSKGCTAGIAFLKKSVVLFKNRDLGTKYITRNMFTFETTPLFRSLWGVNLEKSCTEGVSIGVNRHGIGVANTHVATTPHMTYDMLCEEILRRARTRRDIPLIVRRFVGRNTLQGGRIIVAGLHPSSPVGHRPSGLRRVLHWGYLVEVYGKEFRIKTLRGNCAITNRFSLFSYKKLGLKPPVSICHRLKTANLLIKEAGNIRDIKSLIRSHIPEKSGNSICRHSPDTGTESSHIISIWSDHVTWSSLVGNPCEHDYQTIDVF